MITNRIIIVGIKSLFLGDDHYEETEIHHHENHGPKYTTHPVDHRGHYDPVQLHHHSSEPHIPYENSVVHHAPVHVSKSHLKHDTHHTKHSSYHHEKDYKKNDDQYYQFGFQVNYKNKVSHGHMEFQKGDKKVGQYKIQLPDGRLQVVSYEADAYGYRPVVRFIHPKKKHKDVHPHEPFGSIYTAPHTPEHHPVTHAPRLTTTLSTTKAFQPTKVSSVHSQHVIHPKVKKEKNQNIIVIQLPDSYGNSNHHLKSTVHDIVNRLTKTHPEPHPTFGTDDFLPPKKRVNNQPPTTQHQVIHRPSLRFSDTPSYELTAENRHPSYYPEYPSYGQTSLVESSDITYVVPAEEEYAQEPIYVLARKKNHR
eukprot:TRINITY_DN5102_c0_g1_i1.p1 TRINITY_DN5102_c0_g1~~TRINITY_DN5102_c0_g1_i1.p1  ORF type:complete len:365 (-),score=35.64 TRINITY_DN5102_c0_g1_i1:148-1242(-)